MFPLVKEHLRIVFYPVVVVWIIICLEVVLFSFGILKYIGDITSQEYGGIFRISTSVGAEIGERCILGTGAVISGKIPPLSIVVGNLGEI